MFAQGLLRGVATPFLILAIVIAVVLLVLRHLSTDIAPVDKVLWVVCVVCLVVWVLQVFGVM